MKCPNGDQCHCHAAARRAQASRIRRLATGEANPVHGRVSTYRNYQCRCELCKQAATEVARTTRPAPRWGEPVRVHQPPPTTPLPSNRGPRMSDLTPVRGAGGIIRWIPKGTT